MRITIPAGVLLATTWAWAHAQPTPSNAAEVVPATPPGRVSDRSTANFNPAISLILSGLYARTSTDPATYSIAGFPLPPAAEIGPGSRGFSLAETELGLSASIDPWLQGKASIALSPDDEVSVEEAYIATTALGSGFTLKAGRYFSGVGYLNEQHAHTWDFVDSPLAYQAMLGTQLGDDGVQLRWLAPTELFVEVGVEAGRGRGFPGGGDSRNGAGMTALSLHAGGDAGASHSWRGGVSVLGAKADAQALGFTDPGGNPVDANFGGRTRTWIVDAVWKWAPNGDATRTNFKLQGEYLRSRRSGSLAVDPAGANSVDGYRVVQSGWYLQGVYQFVARWRAGVRVERLDPGRPEFGSNAANLASPADRPRKNSVMLDFSPSEFSRVRLQLANDRSREGVTDRQVFVQYQASLGAHGAHGY